MCWYGLTFHLPRSTFHLNLSIDWHNRLQTRCSILSAPTPITFKAAALCKAACNDPLAVGLWVTVARHTYLPLSSFIQKVQGRQKNKAKQEVNQSEWQSVCVCVVGCERWSRTPPFACLPPPPLPLPFRLPPAGGLPNHVFSGVLLMFHSLGLDSRGRGVIPLPKWRLLSP